MNKSLLIIGKPFSSKTVFMTQFYTRLLKKKSKLVLHEAIENLSFLSTSKAKLAEGELPISTPTELNEQVMLPVRYNEQVIHLDCPDYGGEQIDKIIAERELDENWIKAIKKSDNWIIFIRPTGINKSNDLSNALISKENIENKHQEEAKADETIKNDNQPLNNIETKQDIDTPTYQISDQSGFIELLQILLDTKSNNLLVKNKTTKLTIVLTCWDELDTNETPETVLKNHFPLLFDFIDSIWDKENFKTIGLAALEFDLKIPENKEKYEIDGPESYGYIVHENGQQSKDLTELVFEAL